MTYDWMDTGRNAIRNHRSPDWLERGQTVKWQTTMGPVAAWVVKNQKEPDQVKIRMVGDDRDFYVSRSELTEDEFGGCGQIGCGHGYEG